MIAEKNEIVTTARADTARARTALRMAIRRQAAWRAARAATVQRRAGMAASDAILEAVEDRDEAVGAADIGGRRRPSSASVLFSRSSAPLSRASSSGGRRRGATRRGIFYETSA